MAGTNNMTTGSPAKHILRFAVPLLLGNPAAWIAADVFLVIAFALILRREKRRVAARE